MKAMRATRDVEVYLGVGGQGDGPSILRAGVTVQFLDDVRFTSASGAWGGYLLHPEDLESFESVE